MKKYKITKYDQKIEEFEIIKETDKTLTFVYKNWDGREIERRELKGTSYYKWFDTKEQAKNALIERSKREVEEYKRLLLYAEKALTEAYAIEL